MVEDTASLIVGLLFCGGPFMLGALVGVALLVRQGLMRRIASLEGEIAQLYERDEALLARLARLEGDPPATVEAPAAAAPPVDAPPVAAPPVETPPVETPPVETPPVETPPVAAPPVETPTSSAPLDAAPLAVPPPAESTAPTVAPEPQAASSAEPPSTPPAAPSPAPTVGWEQWIGVRGAAALGAGLFVLAGIYFFQYSVERGLIPPPVRVIAGTLFGLFLVGVSELRLRRTAPVLAQWLAGAGIGVLYVAFWAGQALFDLYPGWVAGVLLTVVTAACVALAHFRKSAPIAFLGLAGGFCTPLALAEGDPQPVALFSYLFLLTGAILWLAHRQRWPGLAFLALIAVLLYQQSWLWLGLDASTVPVAVVVIAVFAALFALSPGAAYRDTIDSWSVLRAAGVLAPLALTLPLAMATDLGQAPMAVVIQVLVLMVASGLVSLRTGRPIVATGAALGGVGVLIGWGLTHPPDTLEAALWFVGLAVALPAALQPFVELSARRTEGEDAQLAFAGLVATTGGMLATGIAAPIVPQTGFWPWAAAAVVLTLFALRLGRLPSVHPLLWITGAVGGFATGLIVAPGSHEPTYPSGALVAAVGLLPVLVYSASGLVGAPAARRAADRGAWAHGLALILFLPFLDLDSTPDLVLHGVVAILGALTVFAAVRWGPSWPPVVAVLFWALASWAAVERADEPLGLAVLGATVLALAAWPLLAPAGARNTPAPFRVAAFGLAAFLLPLRSAYLGAVGEGSLGVVPAVLAALALVVAFAARRRGPGEVDPQRAAMVWPVAAAAAFVTLIVPLQLSEEWLTIGWALQALAFAAVWRRFDHIGLKYLVLGLTTVVLVRLLLNPDVLTYHARGWPILNWIAYTYLVPCVALFGVWWLTKDTMVERRRKWERVLFGDRAVLSSYVVGGALLLLFAWVNLAILDAFGPLRELSFDRQPARDLSLSIAWAVYAVGLLVAGLVNRSVVLRAASLVLVLVVSAKVFLYDLAYLSDLYRVASLFGLAVSLIVVSLVYQRFVFRSAPVKEPS